MGTYNDTFRSASDLTGIARGAADAVEAADVLTTFLPSAESATLDYDLDADTLGLPRAASFRAYDATAPYGKEKSIGTRKGSLPASSIKLPLGELQQLRFRQAGDDEIGAALERKARNNGQSIAIRAIFARGQAIADGIVTMAGENGLTVAIDFGRPAGHTVAAGTAWSNIAATAINDLLGWQATYDAANGGQATTAITSSAVLNALALNTQFIAAATRLGSSGLTRISRADVLSVLADYANIQDVIVYDKQYEDITGATSRVIPQDRFILTPPRDAGIVGDSGPVGSTLWGVPAEAFESSYGISGTDQPGIFTAAFKDNDPERLDVLSSSIFLPVPSTSGVKATFSADVL
jgi:Phage major capsid protein E